MNIDAEIRDAFAGLIGRQCCRQRVGRNGSLSVGFGDKIFHSKGNTVDPFYGEWEIGTYYSTWRIVQHGQFVCGGQDSVNSRKKLDVYLQTLELGAVTEVDAPSELNIRVTLERGLHIDFMRTSDDDDEMFHVFGPKDIYVGYKCLGGWTVDKSNEPCV